MFEVFNATSQVPFNHDKEELEKVDLKRVQDLGNEKPRTYNKGGDKRPYKPKQADVDPENEPDPDWIEFDPEKERSKFFGHVMTDEAKLRERVVVQKERKLAKEEDRKKKVIENAKRAALTTEQKDLIHSSKDSAVDISKLDQDKLKQAQAIITQIENESYSKFDLDFENKNKGGYRHEDELLTDDQLTDLFSEMKKETQAKRDQETKEMKKFKFDAGENDDDGLLEELGGLEDSEEELEKQEEVAEENEPVKYYNDEFKRELEQYRQMKKENVYQQPTVDGNLNQIFNNFQVFTQ